MKRLALIFSILLSLGTSVVHALSEETIKAAFLERFAMFIQWPHPIERYNVCIYNDQPFANVLRNTYTNRAFNKMPLNVVALDAGSSVHEMSECHILYYRGMKPLQNDKQLLHLQKNHVLTISDNDSDPKKGAIVGFKLDNNSYRIIINQRNLEKASLDASYRLLNFATIIEPTEASK